jgi:hypothetical protein
VKNVEVDLQAKCLHPLWILVEKNTALFDYFHLE